MTRATESLDKGALLLEKQVCSGKREFESPCIKHDAKVNHNGTERKLFTRLTPSPGWLAAFLRKHLQIQISSPVWVRPTWKPIGTSGNQTPELCQTSADQ